jgi:hypothetical protein
MSKLLPPLPLLLLLLCCVYRGMSGGMVNTLAGSHSIYIHMLLPPLLLLLPLLSGA